MTADWPEEDQVLITGLPVAEDTFGVEMLVQMATSAPMAGLAIFILLFFFFRSFSIIIAPMVVAIVSVVSTMGLLIGLGYDVHIMSSMIAIFLMPIAVADSVHILSEFYDTYPRFKDKEKTVRHVIGHLFQPMLFTSLTTIAGFEIRNPSSAGGCAADAGGGAAGGGAGGGAAAGTGGVACVGS